MTSLFGSILPLLNGSFSMTNALIALLLYRKEELMKMGICNVLTMAGLLMGLDPVLGSLRRRLRDPKLELLGRPERVP